MCKTSVNQYSLLNHLKQIPEITEFVYGKELKGLIPEIGGRRAVGNFNTWDDKPADVEVIWLEQMTASLKYFNFYDFKLVMGQKLTDTDPESMVLLNESAVEALGWHDPIGKQFSNLTGQFTVKGVIKNIHISPTIQVMPYFYLNPPISEHNDEVLHSMIILFKYNEGMWKSCKEKIEQLFDQNYSGFDISIYNSEEEYKKNFKSENNLVMLLSFVSAICILICVFGFVSFVFLTCEERRKSVAIRKVNGAMANDILTMFAKEYLLLLIIGAIIAFTTAYVVMQHWLENYVKQTSIPAWIYLVITIVMALLIFLCVGCQVYRVSIENPTKVMKIV